MRTIGKLIKEARVRKRLSLKKVETQTKIKKDFINNIEKENWQKLPDYSVVSGFVKSLASFLKIDEEMAMALLRRDYPPKPVSVNPKKDVGNRFVWGPKITFLLGVTIVLIAIAGYLGIQYFRFVSPPRIDIIEPKEGQVVESRELKVMGSTDSDATIRVNNQPAIVDSDGNFATTIEISEKMTEIEIKAESRAGRETVVRRKIKVNF